MFAHCVPLPAPGPPRTNITDTEAGSNIGVSFGGAERRGEAGGEAIAGMLSFLMGEGEGKGGSLLVVFGRSCVPADSWWIVGVGAIFEHQYVGRCGEDGDYSKWPKLELLGFGYSSFAGYIGSR